MNPNIKVNKKLVTLAPVRRGDWLIKLSVLNGQILLVASHLIDLEKIEVNTFYNPQSVFDFIEFLVKDEL